MFTRSALDKSDKKIKEIFERLGLNQAQLDAFVKYFGGDRQSHSTGNILASICLFRTDIRYLC